MSTKIANKKEWAEFLSDNLSISACQDDEDIMSRVYYDLNQRIINQLGDTSEIPTVADISALTYDYYSTAGSELYKGVYQIFNIDESTPGNKLISIDTTQDLNQFDELHYTRELISSELIDDCYDDTCNLEEQSY